MKTAVVALLALISLPGCSTVQKADDILAWTKERLDNVDAKVEELKADQQARIEKYEAVVGAFDENGDGNVTPGEAKGVVVNATKTPEGRKVLLDPEFWGTLAAAALGAYGLKSGVKKLYHGPQQPPEPKPAQQQGVAA
jgi:hypothetical protein